MKTNLKFLIIGILLILCSGFSPSQKNFFDKTQSKNTKKSKFKIIDFDLKKSTFKWTGYGEIGGYSLSGTIYLKTGNFKLENNNIKRGTIIIDMTSIKHSDNHLKEHLIGEDFFEVDKYPKATFMILNSKKIGSNEVEVFGNMTVKKITKPIVIRMKQNQNNYAGTISINRTVFGVHYNSKSFFDNLGDQAIKDNFDLEFNLVGNERFLN